MFLDNNAMHKTLRGKAIVFFCAMIAANHAFGALDGLPQNSLVKKDSNDFSCDYGYLYRAEGRSCTKIEIPTNAYLDHSGLDWSCSRSFQKIDESCVKIEVPSNAYLAEWRTGWHCERGYQSIEERCEAITLPLNAYLIGSGTDWRCEKNYEESEGRCISIKLPRNAYYVQGGVKPWICDRGFMEKDGRCKVVAAISDGI